MLRSLMCVVSLGLVGCVSTKAPAPKLAECKAVVEQWAGQDPVQGIPQGDGGVIFVKPKLDGSHHLLILVSKKNEGRVMQDVKKSVKTAVVISECAHPQTGYPYTTLQFVVAPDLQQARN